MTEKLSERVERLEGPDQGVDADICIALGIAGPNSEGAANIRRDDVWEGDLIFEIDGEECCNPIPPLTSSLDAAMSLVPEGWEGVIHIGSDPSAGLFMLHNSRSHKNSRAATPAIALCAAALKARGL